jgi:hypothetical protein
LCGSCELQGKLHCDRGNKKRTFRFYSSLVALIASSLLSLGITTYFVPGAWWTIPLFLVYWPVYQLYVELIIHCPHCPYWDDSSDEIICLANSGIRKPQWRWLQPYLRYNPRPYSLREKAALHVFNSFSVIFPAAVLGIGATMRFHWSMAACAALLLAAAGTFIFVLRTKMCAGCAHVHCPLNAVPQDTRKAFLAKNPCMSEDEACPSCKGCSQ